MKTGIIFLVVFLFSFTGFSQEMLRNGDFEKVTKCPPKMGLWTARDWKPQGLTTPDLICNCLDTLSEVEKKNSYITASPKSGRCMMGLRLDVWKPSYREFIYIRLNTKLKKGRKYNLSFYIKQVEESSFSIASIDFLFTERTIIQQDLHKMDLAPQIRMKDEDFLKCREEWVKMDTTYEATGKEKYLYIGNFTESSKKTVSFNYGINPKSSKYKEWDLFSYYIMDSISLSFPQPKIEEKKELDIPEIIEPIVVIDEDFRFNFKSGSAKIPHENYSTLDSLIGQLKSMTGYEITITGHTDDIGEEKDNLKLSKERAQSIADYLIKNEIIVVTENIIGKGESDPLCETHKEACRELNRRVNLIVQTKK